MKTNIDIAIESWVKDGAGWTFPTDPKNEDADWVEFNELSADRRAEVCKEYGVSEDFMHEILAQFTNLEDNIHRDLADIWKRLDAMERP